MGNIQKIWQRDRQEERMHGEELDEMDQRILDVIRDHARMTYREIGEAVGISRVSVKSRMSAMEEAGIIRGYRTELGTGAGTAGIRFELDIEAEPEHLREICDYLAGEKMIRKLWVLTGSSHLQAHGTAGNQKMLDYLVRSILRGLSGVRNVRCHTILTVLMDRDGGVDYGDQEHKHMEGREGEQGNPE